MPNYISHAIFGESLFKKIKSENSIYSDISLDDLKTFSLGADLSYYSSCSNSSHNKNTKQFFLEMIKYIKRKGLEENKGVIAYLYGHIGHYVLDKNVHPFVYYNATNMKNTSFVSPHMFIELYIDYYYSKKIKKMDVFKLNGNSYCLKGNFSSECQKITNYLYMKVYNASNVKKSYFNVIRTFKILESFVKAKFFDKNIARKIIRFDDILRVNHLNESDIANEEHSEWTIPVTGEQHSESLLQLYDKSLTETIDSLKVIDSFLYNESALSDVEQIFDNSSYDTGVDCDLGKVMKYVRK